MRRSNSWKFLDFFNACHPVSFFLLLLCLSFDCHDEIAASSREVFQDHPRVAVALMYTPLQHFSLSTGVAMVSSGRHLVLDPAVLGPAAPIKHLLAEVKPLRLVASIIRDLALASDLTVTENSAVDVALHVLPPHADAPPNTVSKLILLPNKLLLFARGERRERKVRRLSH